MTQSGHRLTSRPTPSSVLVGVKYNAMSEPQGQAGETLCDIMLDNKTPAAARVAATNSHLRNRSPLIEKQLERSSSFLMSAFGVKADRASCTGHVRF